MLCTCQHQDIRAVTFGCEGCMRHARLLDKSFHGFCRRALRPSTANWRRCQHRASHTAAAAKKQHQAKKSKDLQNGQASFVPVSADIKATLSDYLHFGRLIGQQPDEVESALKSKAMQMDRDPSAEDYLTRWQAEEAPTHALMETLLQGSRGSSLQADKKLMKAKNRVPNNDIMQFVQETQANAKQNRSAGLPGKRSTLRARGPTAKVSLQTPPRLAGSPVKENAGRRPGAAKPAKPAGPTLALRPTLVSRPKPAELDKMRWNEGEPGSQSASLHAETLMEKPEVKPPKLHTPGLSYESFDMLLETPSGRRKPKSKTGSGAGKQDQDSHAHRAQSTTPDALQPPPSLPSATQASTDGHLATFKAQPGRRRSAQNGASDTPVIAPAPVLKPPPPGYMPPVDPKAASERSPRGESRRAGAPDPALQGPPQGFRDKQTAKSKSPVKSKGTPLPALLSRPAAHLATAPQDEGSELQTEAAAAPSPTPAIPPGPLLAARPKLDSPAATQSSDHDPPSEVQSRKRHQPTLAEKVHTFARPKAESKKLDAAGRKPRKPAAPPATPAADPGPKVELASPSATPAADPRPRIELASPPPRARHPNPANQSDPALNGIPVSGRVLQGNHIWRRSLPEGSPPGQPPPEVSLPQPMLAEQPARPPPEVSLAQPVLADRPARPPPGTPTVPHQAVRTMETPVLTPRQSLDFARKLMAEQRQLPVVVVAANAGGVLVTNRMFKGFMPLNEMTSVMAFQVLSAEDELRKAAGYKEGQDVPAGVSNSIRRKAMRVLRGFVVTAHVDMIDEEAAVSGGVRIILSAKQNDPGRSSRNELVYQHLPKRHLAILQQNIGEIVEGLVVWVRGYGCFVAFDVEAEDGEVIEVYGMVHVSEIAWDFCQDARRVVKNGETVAAKIMMVDASSCKVWLSMRQVKPDPLQETLDALLAEGDPTSLAPLLPSDADDDPAELDEADLFVAAEQVARTLVLLPDVDAVEPGRLSLLESSVPHLQVYLRKPDLQEATASAMAAGAGDIEEASPAGSDEASDLPASDGAAATSAGSQPDADAEGVLGPEIDEIAGKVEQALRNLDPTQDAAAQVVPQVLGPEDDDIAEDVAQALRNMDYAPDPAAEVVAKVLGPEDDDIAKDVAQALRASGFTGSPETNDDEDPDGRCFRVQEAQSASAPSELPTAADAEEEDDDENDDHDSVAATASFDWEDDCDSTVCTLVVQEGNQQQELLISGGITRQELSELAAQLSAASELAAELSAAAEELVEDEGEPNQDDVEQVPANDDVSSLSAHQEALNRLSSSLASPSPQTSVTDSVPEQRLDVSSGASVSPPSLQTARGVSGSEQTPDAVSSTTSAPEQLLNESSALSAAEESPTTGISQLPAETLTSREGSSSTSGSSSGQSESLSAAFAHLKGKTVVELKEICRNNNIKGYSGLAKAELVEYIIAHRG